MTGSDSNGAVIAVFLKAGTGSNSLGVLAGGTAANFAKVGLIDTASLSKEATITKREAENSKISIKTIAQGKERSITVNALIPTNVVLSCAHGYIADYYASGGVDIPDDINSFEAECILVMLDEDEEWDETANLAYNSLEYWKSAKVIPNGSVTYDGSSSEMHPFEVHLQRASGGDSLRVFGRNDGSGIDVTEEYVDFTSVTS
jgi:hypothetical protein